MVNDPVPRFKTPTDELPATSSVKFFVDVRFPAKLSASEPDIKIVGAVKEIGEDDAIPLVFASPIVKS